MFSGNAYFRYIRADTVNPNRNTSSLDESVYQPTAADQAALAAAGSWFWLKPWLYCPHQVHGHGV